MKIKIGIMQGRLVNREIKNRLQSFPWKNWKREIKLANKHNIKYIEWTLDYKKFNLNPLIRNTDKVSKILKKNKIKVKTLTADFFMQQPPFYKKNQTTLFLKKLIKVANFIGIKYIVIPLVDNSSIKNKLDEKKILDYFNFLKQNTNFRKVKILFEFDLPPNKLLSFISKLDNSFGINYDVGNSAYYGHKFSNEKKYFSRVHNIHIKDRKKNGISVPLGTGLVDFKNFFSFLKKIRYSKLMILQTFIPRKKNVLKDTIKNYMYVKKFYEKKN